MFQLFKQKKSNSESSTLIQACKEQHHAWTTPTRLFLPNIPKSGCNLRSLNNGPPVVAAQSRRACAHRAAAVRMWSAPAGFPAFLVGHLYAYLKIPWRLWIDMKQQWNSVYAEGQGREAARRTFDLGSSPPGGVGPAYVLLGALKARGPRCGSWRDMRRLLGHGGPGPYVTPCSGEVVGLAV